MSRKLPRPKMSWRMFSVDALLRVPAGDIAAEPDGTLRPRTGFRGLWLGAAIGLGYLALAAQASALMLLPDPQLERQAKIQFEDSIEVEGKRGDLLDRNNLPIAATVELMALHADPLRLNEDTAKKLARALAPLIEKDAVKLEKRLTIPGRRDVLLAKSLTPLDMMDIKQSIALLGDRSIGQALWTVDEPERFYPAGDEAAPLVGVVGHSGAGLAGLERMLDAELRGGTYKYVLWRDRKGRRITPDQFEARSGNSVVLTLDRRIQHVTEEALKETMERTQAEAAFAVVMDVATGEILAMANRPTQNPNQTQNLKLAQFKNSAALDAIEPGSVFKPFVAAAALQEGIMRPESIIDCENGAWAVGRTIINDDHPKAEITLSEVIKYSSNVGASKLAFQMGAETTLDYLQAFGFGKKTGLNLPGETRGLMRKADKIKPIELATTAFGQGVTVNTVHLASALSALGNDGMRMKPILTKEIRDPQNNTIRVFKPEEVEQVVSPEVARETVEMMVGVTQEGGTGTRAAIEGYLVAGKTGTAQKVVDGRYSPTARIGSFSGLVPGDDPKVAIVVVVDTPHKGSRYGGVVAGPAFKAIGKEVLRVYGISPDPTLMEQDDEKELADAPEFVRDESPNELSWTSKDTLRLPNLSGLSLRDALVVLEGSGLAVRIQGTGRVHEQTPKAGAEVALGELVEVALR